jgi:hypothetical protein
MTHLHLGLSTDDFARRALILKLSVVDLSGGKPPFLTCIYLARTMQPNLNSNVLNVGRDNER